MFQLTSEETAVKAQLDALKVAEKIARNALYGIDRYIATPDTYKAAQDAVEAATKAVVDFTATPEAQVVVLKEEFSKAITNKLQGLDPNALLTLAEQFVDPSTNPELARVGAAFRKVVLNIANAASDTEIHEAFARCTRARFDALVKAGFTVDETWQLILAEASKPYPNINFK